MPLTRKPHDSWASVYDTAYSRSFGSFYEWLTTTTLDAVGRYAKPSARVVDFGAGTGRLAVPLSQLGYQVTAVEPSQAMLEQLRLKDTNNHIEAVCEALEAYDGHERFDLALCVFTVIAYLLDDETLERALQSAFLSIKPGGALLLDVPSRAIFHGYSASDDSIERNVALELLEQGLYRYTEELHVDGQDYTDQFLIRFWPLDTVLDVALRVGFVLEEDLSDEFGQSGAHYILLRKPGLD